MSQNKVLVFPVDEQAECKDGEVLVKNNEGYTCVLNQTNIASNNNKFYKIQLINVPGGTRTKGLYLFTCYGRIGEKGNPSMKMQSSEEIGIKNFEKQFKSKTGNNWKDRKNFIKYDGKYFISDIRYEIDQSDAAKITNINNDSKKLLSASKLDERTQKLIGLISDIKTINKTLVEMNFDTKKCPLGKLSDSQLDKAQIILQSISRHINNVKTNNDVNKIDTDNMVLKLSSEFYQYVPYSCGRKKPPLINTVEKIGEYNQLIDDLKNITIAVKIMDSVSSNTDTHPMDTIYNSLKAKITPLDKDSDMWRHITNYVQKTHAPTHSYKLELLDIYQIEREGEGAVYDEYTKTNNIKNKMLLYHGSAITNFLSIISKGLILNPETLGVYIAGKMFGQGIYHANSVSKSVNYCAYQRSNNIAALLLNDVALGNQSKRTNADYYISKKTLEKENCHSTWGLGKSTPSSHVYIKDEDISIPNGALTNSNIPNANLLYDEFIIYDTKQHRQKYLIIVKVY